MVLCTLWRCGALLSYLYYLRICLGNYSPTAEGLLGRLLTAGKLCTHMHGLAVESTLRKHT